NLSHINENLKNLEAILTKHDIYQKSDFKAWFNDFKKIYGKKQVNLHLYSIFALIYLIGYVFISKFILKNKNILSQHAKSLKMLKNVETELYLTFNNLDLFKLNYFDPIFSLSEKENLEFFNSLILSISNSIFKKDITPEYYFDYLIQKLISPIIRHKSGEYYTPPFLVKMMIKDSYKFGEAILDPCCGSGNFLTEVVKLIMSKNDTKEKKITAINNIYGFDINPISIFLTKVNLLYLIKDIFPGINLNLFVFDSLFQTDIQFSEKFDLIIGNPPWYTYRDIDSIEYQKRIKSLAEELGIKPRPKNLLNLEISTIFFINAKNRLLKQGAEIFFVITKGVITGSHASRFRNFKGFTDVKIWTFDKQIENIFNIDFICLYGRKSKYKNQYYNREIKSYHFKLKSGLESINYFQDIELTQEKEEILKPYFIEEKAGKKYTKKLISDEIRKDLLPIKESYYKSLFHKGADLNPRNLIFVNFEDESGSLVKINPDSRIFNKAKSPWNKKEFKNQLMEKNYIFDVVKSTELVKFYIYNYYHVFLPLSKVDLSFSYNSLDKYSRLFYDKINNIYKKYKKETTKHRSLIENLDRWSKLINQRQLSKIKVVYNNSGSVLQSAVIQGNFLITGDLTFFDTEDLEEAFYLSAILNSNLLTDQVKIMKSSRHIFKLPLDIPIKKFDPKNSNHLKLTELARKGQALAKQSINTFIENNTRNYTKIKIQNVLSEKVKPILVEIDDILRREFQPN
ncbi:MAG: class I SAM-dependent DNA methyltransferase, partial [Candidatus Heimdallarchaeota archaeon]